MSSVLRPLIVKVDAFHYRMDLVANQLIEAGFQLVRASTVKEGIRLARRCKPVLILTIDNPRAGIDGAHWLEVQHSDSEVSLAMTPLLILAETGRAERLKVHELPDRVQILPLMLTPEQLVWHIHDILSVWSF